MEFEQELMDRINIHMNETDGGEESGGRIDAYFAKINSSFVDPSLELSLDEANKTLASLTEQKSRISIEMESVKNEIYVLQTDMERELPWSVRYGVRDKTNDINRYRLRELLEKYWPESINEDPDDVPDPVIEEAFYNKRTQIDALSHRSNNIVEEKRMIKELDHLNRRKEKLDREVKEAEAKIPKPARRWDKWRHGTKFDIFRNLRVALKELKEREKVAKAPYEQRFAEHRAKLEYLEKRYNFVEQEMKRVDTNVLELQLQLQKQATVYNKYCKLVKKVKQFAKQGEFVALEELVCKEVEDVMCRWSNDEAFRANYTRSIQLSLTNRGLSSDGRMQDASE